MILEKVGCKTFTFKFVMSIMSPRNNPLLFCLMEVLNVSSGMFVMDLLEEEKDNAHMHDTNSTSDILFHSDYCIPCSFS